MMNLKRFKPLGAAFFLLLLCSFPGDALSAASEAFLAWALSVAPALLPFLIAAPALTDREITALLARFSGPLLRFFRLPAHSTGALLIGLLSGSPSGAAALSSVPPEETDPPGAYLRAALMASGASPAFLLTGVAVSLLNRPETGPLLLRSQLLSVFLTGLLLRFFGCGRPDSASSARETARPVPSAMLTLLTVGGWMAFFAVLARLLTRITHPNMETPLLVLFELAGGCRALASLPRDLSLLLPLISAAACFGGLSVSMQCMSFLAPLHVHPAEYAAGKLLQAALAALFTFLQLERPWKSRDPLLLLPFCLLLLLLFLLFKLRFRRPVSVSK